MKISPSVCAHIAIISWKFCILNSNHSRVIHPQSLYFSLKCRLLFSVFYCFCMFVNKHFANLKCAKKWCDVQSGWYYFLYKDECIARFSYLHECTFNKYTSYSWYYDILGNEQQVSFKKFLLEMNLVHGKRKWWNGHSKLSRKIAIELTWLCREPN